MAEPDITEFLNPRLVSRVQPVPKLFSFLIILLGVLDLLGWKFNITLLKSVSPDFVSMTPNSAVCLIFSAIAVLLAVSARQSYSKLRYVKMIGILVTVVGCLTLLQYFMKLDLGIDSFLFGSSINAEGIHESVRMEPITAINLALLGIALYFFGQGKTRIHPPSHLLAFPIGLIAALPMIGYLYQSKFLIGIDAFSAMSPQTALCFLMMSVVLLVTRLDHDLAAILVSDGPGGAMARRLLPAAILFPLILGGLRVWGETAGLLSYEFGTALFTTVNIAGFLLLIWFQSIAIQEGEAKQRAIRHDRDLLNIENDMREQFVSMLSHDLRTPVTAASAYAQMIQRSPEKSELSKSHAEKIVTSMMRIDKMTRNILDVNHLRAGHPLQLNMDECDLKTIVEEVLATLTVIHGNHFAFEQAEQIKGWWDCAAVQRAIENLCSNAVKYGEPDSKITIRIDRSKEKVRLSVHNLGDPIPLDAQKTLFEPFSRAGSGTKQMVQGWGVGLSVVRAIAEAHGGVTLVESTKELGTTFTIDLPIMRPKKIL